MARHFNRHPANESEPYKVLFVYTNEEDTSFLAQEVPIKVTRASWNEELEGQRQQQQSNSLVMNLASRSRAQVDLRPVASNQPGRLKCTPAHRRPKSDSLV